ncbi:amidase [Pigmentiphaga soli]|uniref:Amidase n=1 Tax=Pigmentiphaga soli TaxID=1007095 RepID=A0ABP8HNM5_9BURK
MSAGLDAGSWRLPVVELGRMLTQGATDPVELAEYFIARIQTCPDRAVLISTCFERARGEAAQSAARHRAGKPLGPLDGIPVIWKDNIDVAGSVTTAGSALFRDAAPAREDAAVVRRLAAAGMVTLGKANLSEFAYTALGMNPHFGTPRNPLATGEARVPGGSSSGSAVAVAAGLAPVAIGTDTGGSTRVPAAFNGLVGFKPAESRYDRTGVFPLSTTLDTVGVLARGAADCLLVDRALTGEDEPDEGRPLPLSEVSIVVPHEYASVPVEPEVTRNFLDAVDRLEKLGARVKQRSVPELEMMQRLVDEHGAFAAAEAYAVHAKLLESRSAERMDPFVRARMLAGRPMAGLHFTALREGRLRLRRSLRAAAGDALIAVPTVPHVAPLLEPLANDPALFAQTNLRTISNTHLGNLLNLCGLAIPSGTGQAGMPTSILFQGMAGTESALLRAGVSLQAALERG